MIMRLKFSRSRKHLVSQWRFGKPAWWVCQWRSGMVAAPKTPGVREPACCIARQNTWASRGSVVACIARQTRHGCIGEAVMVALLGKHLGVVRQAGTVGKTPGSLNGGSGSRHG